MTVRDLRQILYAIEDQDAQIVQFTPDGGLFAVESITFTSADGLVYLEEVQLSEKEVAQ